MACDSFVVRVGSALVVTGLFVSTVGCGGDANGLAAVTSEVDLSGDLEGCSTSMAVGSEGPVPNPVAEPAADHGVVAWSTQDPGGFEVEATAVTSDVLFVGAGPAVSALTAVDGKPRWQQSVDTGDLTPIREEVEDGVSTYINQLAVSDNVLAVAVTERTVTFEDDSGNIDQRSIVAVLDPASGAQRWVSEVFGGGPAPLLWGAPLEVIDDLVVVEVHKDFDDTVWAFDAATGNPRWRADGRLAGGGDGTVYVYGQDRCLIYAVDATDGVEKWSLPTPPLVGFAPLWPPVQVVPDGDDVVIVWTPLDAPVVVARVDASTAADVWRFHLPAGGLQADVAVDHSSLRLAIERQPDTTGLTVIDVFELDSQSGEARWATQIPLAGLVTNDIDEMLDAYPFTYDTELTVVPAGSTLQVSTGPDLYTLSSSNGMVARMLDVDGTLAELFVGPGRDMVMRSNALADGVVATAADTVARIQ